MSQAGRDTFGATLRFSGGSRRGPLCNRLSGITPSQLLAGVPPSHPNNSSQSCEILLRWPYLAAN